MYTIVATNKKNGVKFRTVKVFSTITTYSSLPEACEAVSKLAKLPGFFDQYDMEIVLTTTADKLGVI